MRIIAAADIHGVCAVYEWLVEHTRNGADALVLAGDLLASDFKQQQRIEAKRIIRLLKTVSVPVLYVMGNDDNVGLNYEDTLIKPIHGRRFPLAGLNFIGYQYSPPFVGNEFVKTDEEISKDLELLRPLVDENTVFVTHSPAWGHLDLCFENHAGSRAIGALLEERAVLAHIHGHIHEAFGRDGNHFNVASAGVCRAMLIEMPSLVHRVLTNSRDQ